MIFFADPNHDDIAYQIAADEALLVACEQNLLAPHTSAMRLWQQRSWAVVLGASGRVADDVHAEECRRRGVPVARRSSGGGTVLLGPGTACLAWVLPLAEFPSDQRDVRVLQVSVLERVAERFRQALPGLEVVASGDWAIAGRKCAGSAQRRMKTHVLVHLSILNRLPLAEVRRFLAEPSRRPEYRSERTHDDFLTNLDIEPTRLYEYLSSFPEISERREEFPKHLSLLADRLADERFRLSEWTYRF
ncbi:lipoate--protein ligase family protein [bacterium]|nr:lipoate--protein ligase family protein [bacterium]